MLAAEEAHRRGRRWTRRSRARRRRRRRARWRAPADAGPARRRRREPARARAPALPHARIVIAGRPEPRPATTPWRLTWQWVAAAAVTAGLAWLTYSGGGWIPLLSAFDLARARVRPPAHVLGAAAALLARRLAAAGRGPAGPRRVLLVASRRVRGDPHGRVVGGEPAQRVRVHRRRRGDAAAALRRRRVRRGPRLAQHPARAERAGGHRPARARGQDLLGDPLRRGGRACRTGLRRGRGEPDLRSKRALARAFLSYTPAVDDDDARGRAWAGWRGSSTRGASTASR